MVTPPSKYSSLLFNITHGVMLTVGKSDGLLP